MLTRCFAAEVLGVGLGDKDEVIRAAYRKIALSCHPDDQRGGGEARRARERFREVQFNCPRAPPQVAPSHSLSHWLIRSATRSRSRSVTHSHTLSLSQRALVLLVLFLCCCQRGA